MNEMYSVLICLEGCYERYLSIANLLRFAGSFVVTTLTAIAMFYVYKSAVTVEQQLQKSGVGIKKNKSNGDKRRSHVFKVKAFLPWAIPHFTIGLALFCKQFYDKLPLENTLAGNNYNGNFYEVSSAVMAVWGTLEALFYTWQRFKFDILLDFFIRGCRRQSKNPYPHVSNSRVGSGGDAGTGSCRSAGKAASSAKASSFAQVRNGTIDEKKRSNSGQGVVRLGNIHRVPSLSHKRNISLRRSNPPDSTIFVSEQRVKNVEGEELLRLDALLPGPIVDEASLVVDGVITTPASFEPGALLSDIFEARSQEPLPAFLGVQATGTLMPSPTPTPSIDYSSPPSKAVRPKFASHFSYF